MAAKLPSHCPSGGTWSPYRTRLAGFEIGRTNDAALAMNAQMNSSGSGSALAFFAAASTAGVRTTAAASFDRKVVTTMPMP